MPSGGETRVWPLSHLPACVQSVDVPVIVIDGLAEGANTSLPPWQLQGGGKPHFYEAKRKTVTKF